MNSLQSKTSRSGKYRFVLLYGGLGFGSVFAAIMFAVGIMLGWRIQSLDPRLLIRSGHTIALVVTLAIFYSWGCFQGWLVWKRRHPGNEMDTAEH